MAIHQIHCAAKRYCRFLKVTNNIPKVQSNISATLLKVILIYRYSAAVTMLIIICIITIDIGIIETQ